jgi:hypothetical protein
MNPEANRFANVAMLEGTKGIDKDPGAQGRRAVFMCALFVCLRVVVSIHEP